jgi:methyl-accepting chemotaxis protein
MTGSRLDALRQVIARVLLGLVIVHVPVLALLGGLVDARDLLSMLSAAAGLAAIPLVLFLIGRPVSVVAAAVSIALVGQAMLLVLLFSGHPWQVEMHFYFFAVLAMVAGFCDIRILLGSAGAVAVHHLVLNGLLPDALFSGGANLGRVAVHAVVVVIETAMLIVIARVLAASFDEAERADQVARQSVVRLEAAGREMTAQFVSTRDRADRLDNSLATFKSGIASRLGRLGDASSSLEGTAETLSRAALRTTSQTGSASVSAEAANRKVESVAVLGQEFRETISEIGAHAARSASMGAQAVAEAEATTITIDELEAVSQQIGEVTAIIAGIAAQTNLLALNATIEAARAGEHGRGFAVVASEVKDLSAQTTKAVATIGTMVETIRASAARSALAMTSVVGSITSLNDAAGQIAAAVEERIYAAATIADSVGQAAANVNQVTGAIAGIEQVAAETSQQAGLLRSAAIEIAEQTTAIRDEVESFSADLAGTTRLDVAPTMAA